MEQEYQRSRPGKILVAGAEGLSVDELGAKLQGAGFDIVRATTGTEAFRQLSAGGVDLILAEWSLPDLAEGALVRRLHRRDDRTPLVIFGGHIPPERRREMSREGIEEYLELPLELPHAVPRVKAVLDRRAARTPDEDLLLGTSDAIRQVIATVSQIAPYKVSVLVTGESGTGKELVAAIIHEKSPRREGPFVAVNCGALPAGVVESELFGHEKGAFTGAVGERKGRFELADGGTLFLDEVGELPPAVQVQLLRVLEDERFTRVGGTREVQVDVRVVAATNRDLEAAVREGDFRQDLYHRLHVVSVKIPPLRDRPEDIPILAEHFLRTSAQRYGLPVPHLTPAVLEQLRRLPWPGNVRELRNVIDSLVIMASGRDITVEDLPVEAGGGTASSNVPVHVRMTRDQAEKELLYQSLLALRAEISEIKHLILRKDAMNPGDVLSDDAPRPLWEPPEPGARVPTPPPSMAEIEEAAVRRALAFTGGNRREAARILGIGLRTLYRKIRLYGIG